MLVLERIDRTKNMARDYVLSVEPTLFAESSLVRKRSLDRTYRGVVLGR